MARARRSAPPNGPPPSGDDLWDALRDSHRMMRAELRDVLRRRGIFLSEYRALGVLKDREPTMGELAEALGLTPASMTDLIRQLAARRWVRRQRSPADRRVYRVAATPAGARVYRSSRAEYRARLAEVAHGVPPEALAGLGQGLTELKRVLSDRRAAAGSIEHRGSDGA